jgi:hypothetical protein
MAEPESMGVSLAAVVAWAYALLHASPLPVLNTAQTRLRVSSDRRDSSTATGTQRGD